MLYEHMFVLCSAVRNVYTAVGNVHSAVGNVHSALRNIKQKPFPDTITIAIVIQLQIAFVIFIDDCLYIFISSKEIQSLPRAYARAYYVFYFLLSLLSLIVLTIIYTGGYIVIESVIEE